MVHNHHGRRLHNRQDGIPDIPTAAGLTDATTVAQNGLTTASLALNTAAASDNVNHDVNVSISPTNTFTSVPTDLSDSTSSSPSPTTSAVSGSGSSDIAMGTVIGACLGALAACVLIILVGLCLYRRGNKPRRRSPSTAHKAAADKERAWGKLEDDNEDKWEGKEGKYQQKGIVSVGPMEKLTMFKKSTPSVRTAYTTAPETQELPAMAHFDHPFAQYHPNLAKELAQDDGGELPTPRPFLARVETVAPISWDGDTARDSFLSLSSNPAMSPGTDLALPTPKLTSSEPHHWQSAEVIDFDQNSDAPRGRTTIVAESDSEPDPPRRKSSNNPFFGSRMSSHSSHSRSQSRSRTPSISQPNLPDLTMPVPPPPAFTREEKGKYRAVTPPSPTSSMAPSTITGHNPFSDPVVAPPFKAEHASNGSHDRALQSLIAALGSTAQDVEERLRVASMQPSVISQYTETDADEATLHQSWPVPPSRP